MMTSSLFRQCLSMVDGKTRREFDLSFSLAERLDTLLKQKGITRHELAVMLGKKDSEVSKWLTGRHNFTVATIASIESVLHEQLVHITTGS